MNVFVARLPDGTQALIVLANVCVTRWNKFICDGGVRTLCVYFAQSPHVELEEPEGKRFEEALITYYNTRGR